MLSKQKPVFIRAKLLLIYWGFVAHAWAGSLEIGGTSSNKIEYNYDKLDRRTQTIYPSAIAVHHKYNNEDQLIEGAGEFISEQRWIRDRELDAFNDVYALPATIDNAEMSREQMEEQMAAAEAAGDYVNENIYNRYDTEIENGINFGTGFADGISFGGSGWLAENVLYGERSWGNRNSGGYQGGYWTGFVATTVAGSGSVYTTNSIASGGRYIVVSYWSSRCFALTLMSGKWVVNGTNSFGNYLRTGLFAPKLGHVVGPRIVGFGNLITGRARVGMPSNRFLGCDGNWKAYLMGQFRIR